MFIVGGVVAVVASWGEVACQWGSLVVVRLEGMVDVVLGGRSCMLGCIVLVVGCGPLVCVVAAIGDVVWLPCRCGRHGTWWTLVHPVTWPGHCVLER